MRNTILCILLCALFSCTTSHSAAASDTDQPSFLLLNNNRILEGKSVNFKDGFFYFQQSDRIIKISPADFKGIFRSHTEAENTIIILEELSGSPSSGELSETISLIHSKAEIIIKTNTPKECVREMIDELRAKLDSPAAILNLSIYKELLTLSAISAHYQLGKDFSDFFSDFCKKNDIYNTAGSENRIIKIRVKTIEYLIQHPYIYRGQKQDD